MPRPDDLVTSTHDRIQKIELRQAGGVFLVIDYASAPGTGFTQSATLHRGDPEAEKAEILKAGFVFEGESKVLARPNDNHTMRAHEQDDQFILRFRKPR